MTATFEQHVPGFADAATVWTQEAAGRKVTVEARSPCRFGSTTDSQSRPTL
ncbi:hypothetical protein SAMN05444745_106217 [Arthrobacter sp. OV608]|nr:hypothetical protein SAMN05444745_106217 [Arthrobacter sp. OV608]